MRGRRWGSFAVFPDEAGGKLVGEADRQIGMQFPGLVRSRGRHGELRLVPAPGQIEEIGREDGGLKEVLILADGGHHESPPGGPIFYFIE